MVDNQSNFHLKFSTFPFSSYYKRNSKFQVESIAKIVTLTSKRQLRKQGEREWKNISQQGIQQTSPLSTFTNASMRENPSN